MENATVEKTLSLHTGMWSWFRSNAWVAIGAYASTAHVQGWEWWSQAEGWSILRRSDYDGVNGMVGLGNVFVTF